MAFLRPDLVLAEKVLAIGGLVALFGGFAALIYGEFAPSVGFQGLVDQGIGGAASWPWGPAFFASCRSSRATHGARVRAPRRGRRMARRKAAREACIIALNLVCYVGTAFVALGALDRARPRADSRRRDVRASASPRFYCTDGTARGTAKHTN